MKECTTHHLACDCREAKFKALEDEVEFLKKQQLQFFKTRQESIDEQDREVDGYKETIKSLSQAAEKLAGALEVIQNEPNNSDYYLNHLAQMELIEYRAKFPKE